MADRRRQPREVAVVTERRTTVVRGKVAVMVEFLLAHRQQLQDTECGVVEFEWRHQRVTPQIGFRFPTDDADLDKEAS